MTLVNAGGITLAVATLDTMVKIVRPGQRPLYAWFKRACRHWCESLPMASAQCCECKNIMPTTWCVICKA